MPLKDTLKFVLHHPLNQGHRLAALSRFFAWQFKSRLDRGDHVQDWIGSARFYVCSGDTGITGNIYCGLHDFADMAFVLHALRANDCFVDVGSNVGSYTLLASAVVGANTMSFEPVPDAYQRLQANLRLNNITDKVQARNIALGAGQHTAWVTSTHNCTNHILPNQEAEGELEVEVSTIDAEIQQVPFLLKLDVEGYEAPVLAGASNCLTNSSLCCVLVELNGSGNRYGHADADVVARLQGYGFNPYTYHPFERQLSALDGRSLVSGNVLFIRDYQQVMQRLKSAPSYTINKVMI